jgi:hypothetical protein
LVFGPVFEERLLAYIEGSNAISTGDRVGLRINGRQRRDAVVSAISRFHIEIWTPERRIEVDLRPLNESAWDRDRRAMARRAGVTLPQMPIAVPAAAPPSECADDEVEEDRQHDREHDRPDQAPGVEPELSPLAGALEDREHG